MSPPRLVLVTRRFWPLVGGAERVMARLAAGLSGRGWPVTILTARWEEQWPAEIHYAEVPVVRLTQPAQRGWGTLRYMLALGAWLRRHAGSYDLVYVSMLKHDAHAALGAAGGQVPVVVRAEGGGASGDCRWQQQARFGHCIRRRCQQAAALVAPSPAIEDELRGAGYPGDRIQPIPNGVSIPPPRTATARAAARDALADASPSMLLGDAPLALYTGRLDSGKGLSYLLRCWRIVTAGWPNARLWIAGEGAQRDELARRIRESDLEGRVTLTGLFDEVDALLAAADLFVLPSEEEGMSLALLEAMAAGLPIVACDIAGNRPLIADGRQGLLVPPRDAGALAVAVAERRRTGE